MADALDRVTVRYEALTSAIAPLVAAAPDGARVHEEWPDNVFAEIMILVWLQTGFAMVVLSAAIKGVSAGVLEAVDHARALHQRIVMTNGCFDILHAGHVAYLEEAKRLGDRLIVALDTPGTRGKWSGATGFDPLSRDLNALALRRDGADPAAEIGTMPNNTATIVDRPARRMA